MSSDVLLLDPWKVSHAFVVPHLWWFLCQTFQCRTLQGNKTQNQKTWVWCLNWCAFLVGLWLSFPMPLWTFPFISFCLLSPHSVVCATSSQKQGKRSSSNQPTGSVSWCWGSQNPEQFQSRSKFGSKFVAERNFSALWSGCTFSTMLLSFWGTGWNGLLWDLSKLAGRYHCQGITHNELTLLCSLFFVWIPFIVSPVWCTPFPHFDVILVLKVMSPTAMHKNPMICSWQTSGVGKSTMWCFHLKSFCNSAHCCHLNECSRESQLKATFCWLPHWNTVSSILCNLCSVHPRTTMQHTQCHSEVNGCHPTPSSLHNFQQGHTTNLCSHKCHCGIAPTVALANENSHNVVLPCKCCQKSVSFALVHLFLFWPWHCNHTSKHSFSSCCARTVSSGKVIAIMQTIWLSAKKWRHWESNRVGFGFLH